MKKLLIYILSIFSLIVPFPTFAMKDMSALSYAERAAIVGGKVVGTVVGAKVFQQLGRRYIDSAFFAQREPELNFSDLEDLDMDLGDINLELDLDADVPSGKSGKEEQEGADVADLFTAARSESKDREAGEKNKLVGKFFIDLIKPGQRVGFGVGAVAGYNLGGYLINRGIAWRHGVRYSTEKICRFFNLNIGQYKTLVLSAEKKDLKEIREALADFYEKRFGQTWKKRLFNLLYKYDCYASYLVKNKKKLLSESERDLLRMIEIGAAINTIYDSKKPSAVKCVEAACTMYQLLGFMPCHERGDSEVTGESFDVAGDQYRTLILHAEKGNLEAMRKAFEIFYHSRFGTGWQKRLIDLFYKYDCYADYLFQHRNRVLSREEGDLLRMIEIGAEVYAAYSSKKSEPAASVEAARGMYQLLGFMPQSDKWER